MEKPFIFCHMETSLDGKIMGKFLWIPETNTEDDSFFSIAFGEKAKYHFTALVHGRITIEDNDTFYKKPDVDEHAAPVPEGDFLAPGASAGRYFFAIDGHGRIAWDRNTEKEGPFEAHIVEVLTESASNGYKDFLRRMGISYILCGKDRVDLSLFCKKAKELFHVESMMLGGGAVLNWSFIQAGLVDEVSQVIAPAADGSMETQTLFMAKPGLSTDQPVVFLPEEVEVMKDHAVWIRWKVGPKNTYDFDNDKDYREVQDRIRAHKGTASC